MLKTNTVKQALKRGEPVIGTMITEAGSTGFVWMLANLGYDFVFIDMEHSTYGLQATADMIKVARLANLVPLVRIPELSYGMLAPVLDAGAMGIMLPRVETRQQVEELVSYMKYPPYGVRGATAGRGSTDYSGASPQELVRHLNENTMVILQIEREIAVDNIDDLLSVPGVDAAVIGPFDLTISLGEDSMNAPRVNEAIGKVVEAAKRHQVASGIHIADPAVILKWRELGMTMLGCNTDLGFFTTGASKTLSALREGSGRTAGQEVTNIHV
ncbi:MAG: Aldolase [Chloroflexi bacterium]|nr:Aldolase [Chloroflexota bacterium]